MSRNAKPLANTMEDLFWLASCACSGLVGSFIGWGLAYLLVGRCS